MILHACRSCGASISFIATPSGASMPVDPELVEKYVVKGPGSGRAPSRARLVVLVRADGTLARGYEVAPTHPEAQAAAGYVPHWATCSDPGAHRR